MDLLASLEAGGFSMFKRAARLALQLPRTSRYITKIDPSIAWGWPELFSMVQTHSLRMLVWSKTKDATKKNPKDRPEWIGPKFILDAMKQAEKMAQRGSRLGTNKHTPDARVFANHEELDAYLKKPRKAAAD
jgi:hypothetical protein